MKTIESLGGPYVGLNRADVHQWSGVEGKRFIGEHAKPTTDYEGAGELTDGRSHAPCNIAKLVGQRAEALLISMFMEISVIHADRTSAYLAQVHYCDADWTFSRVTLADFEAGSSKIDERIQFRIGEGGLIFFDSSYSAERIENDYLGIELAPGQYIISAALYEPDDRTLLTLVWITMQNW